MSGERFSCNTLTERLDICMLVRQLHVYDKLVKIAAVGYSVVSPVRYGRYYICCIIRTNSLSVGLVIEFHSSAVAVYCRARFSRNPSLWFLNARVVGVVWWAADFLPSEPGHPSG